MASVRVLLLLCVCLLLQVCVADPAKQATKHKVGKVKVGKSKVACNAKNKLVLTLRNNVRNSTSFCDFWFG